MCRWMFNNSFEVKEGEWFVTFVRLLWVGKSWLQDTSHLNVLRLFQMKFSILSCEMAILWRYDWFFFPKPYYVYNWHDAKWWLICSLLWIVRCIVNSKETVLLSIILQKENSYLKSGYVLSLSHQTIVAIYGLIKF